MGAFFVVEAQFLLEGNSVLLDIICYSVWDRKPLISISNKKELNLSTDEDIKELLGEVIPVIKKNLSAIEQQILATKIGKEPDSGGEPAPEPEMQVEVTDGLNQEDSNVSVVDSESKKGLPQDHEPESVNVRATVQNLNRFIIAAGIAPLISTGEATKYFTKGIDISLFGGYCLSTSLGWTTIGLFSTLDQFKADGILISSKNYLLSVGPEIRFNMGVSTFASILFRFSSGASVLMVDANNSGYQNTLIPFISLGLGTDFEITDYFGISVSSNYSVYFEQSTPISGFLPTAGVFFRF